jgi:hypothetical protein
MVQRFQTNKIKIEGVQLLLRFSSIKANQAREGLEWRFHGNSKSLSLIGAAECVLAFAGSYGC